MSDLRSSSRYTREFFRLWCAVASLGLASACGSSSSTNPDPEGPPITGELLISLRTVGDQLDSDGYAFSIDTAPGTQLPINGEVTVSNISVGSRSYQLSGIASNCRLTNRGSTGTITVTQGGESELFFEVLCLEPDPGRIFYTAFTFGNQIQVISALGGDRQSLPLFADKVDVSADQQRLTFNWDGDIWVANVDGTDPVNLTNSPDQIEGRPSWSPDGQRITYDRQSESGGDIFVINADGSEATNLTPNTPWGDGEPEWSPDGSRIAFRSHRSSGGDLWTMAPDGSQLTQLTTDGVLDTNPRWSPDGQQIVFTRFTGEVDEGGTDFELFLINADGTGFRQLTNDAVTNESRRTSEANWSPDGQWMVIASQLFGGLGTGFDLYLMRADGTDRIQITFGERAGLPDWVP